ncbi:hypothetical protein HYT74_03285, partial [Candidatus Daviesbacteria bacterium]|nr:hypothetical protein [Candidatus Daviesbacteria bacterium]
DTAIKRGNSLKDLMGVIIKLKIMAVIYTDSKLVEALKSRAKILFTNKQPIVKMPTDKNKLIGLNGNSCKKLNKIANPKKAINT